MSDSSTYPNSPASSASASSSSSLASDPNAVRLNRELPRNANIDAQHLSEGPESDETARSATSYAAELTSKGAQLVPENQASRKRAISSTHADHIEKSMKKYREMPAHAREAYKEALRQTDLDIRKEEVKRLRRNVENISDHDSDE